MFIVIYFDVQLYIRPIEIIAALLIERKPYVLLFYQNFVYISFLFYAVLCGEIAFDLSLQGNICSETYIHIFIILEKKVKETHLLVLACYTLFYSHLYGM